MRNVIIKRNSAFAGCLVKSKVYIEDLSAKDISINKVPCRKLGTLKSGEEKAFQIDNNSARIYVIADKLSKNYCNDFFTVPEGDQDIYLMGKNTLNPFIGNPFYFDMISGEDVLKNRKKNSKRFLSIYIPILTVLCILGFCLGFFSGYYEDSNAEKTFIAEDMQITLTEEFIEESFSGATACYASYNAAVFVIKEEFSYFENGENTTIEEYAEEFFEYNELDSTLQYVNQLPCFEYEVYDPDYDSINYYMAFIYKSDDAFWVVQFAANKNKSEDLKPEFIKWAESVHFISENKIDA